MSIKNFNLRKYLKSNRARFINTFKVVVKFFFVLMIFYELGKLVVGNALVSNYANNLNCDLVEDSMGCYSVLVGFTSFAFFSEVCAIILLLLLIIYSILDRKSIVNRNDLVEALARLEHEQWVYWSKNIANNERIDGDRLSRWEKLWVPYDKLSDVDKEKDRVWARKVLALVDRLGVF